MKCICKKRITMLSCKYCSNMYCSFCIGLKEHECSDGLKVKFADNKDYLAKTLTKVVKSKV